MKLLPLQKRTWADVDIDVIRSNYRIIRKQIGNRVKLCCVVKANAYGHGAVQLARIYEEEGADFFAVSNIEEGLQLRDAGIKTPILILGYTDPRCAMELAKNNISQCVFSKEYGNSLSSCAVNCNVIVKIHVKIDTGMGRIGFQSYDDEELEDAFEICGLPGLNCEGIFTHFASADEGELGKKYTYTQFKNFMYSVRYLEARGIKFQIRHCANSAAIFDYPEMHLDMVRAGIVLYGLQPSKALFNVANIKPALELRTIIDYVKNVRARDCISYGREYVAANEMRIATIPVGYADGLWRSNYKKHMQVEVEGKLAPIVGRICMDQCMIDITDIPEAKTNSVVTIYGWRKDCSVDNIAELNGTINYEIVCAIGERVPRVYMQNGKIMAIVDNIVPNNKR